MKQGHIYALIDEHPVHNIVKLLYVLQAAMAVGPLQEEGRQAVSKLRQGRMSLPCPGHQKLFQICVRIPLKKPPKIPDPQQTVKQFKQMPFSSVLVSHRMENQEHSRFTDCPVSWVLDT